MAVNEVSGIAGVSRNDQLNALKEQYLKRWPDAIRHEAMLVSKMKQQRGEMINGKYSLSMLRTADAMASAQARAEYDDLPIPDSPSYEQVELMQRAMYYRARVTGPAKRQVKTTQVAWLKPWVDTLRSLRKSGTRQMNKVCHLGNLMVLAGFSQYSTSGTGVITLYGKNARTGAANARHNHGTRYLEVGQQVAAIDASSGNADPLGDIASGAYATGQANMRKIASIDEANGTVTLDATFATDISSTDDVGLLVPWRGRTASVGSEDSDYDSNILYPNGLGNLLQPSARKDYVYAKSRTTYSWLEPGVYAGTDGSLTDFAEALIDLDVDTIDENPYNGGAGEARVMLTPRAVRREFVREVAADRRFSPIQRQRGWGKLGYVAGDKTMTLLSEKHCEAGTLKYLDFSCFGWFQQSGLQEVGPNRFVADKDAEETVMVEEGNFACRSIVSNGWRDSIRYSETALLS